MTPGLQNTMNTHASNHLSSGVLTKYNSLFLSAGYSLVWYILEHLFTSTSLNNCWLSIKIDQDSRGKIFCANNLNHGWLMTILDTHWFTDNEKMAWALRAHLYGFSQVPPIVSFRLANKDLEKVPVKTIMHCAPHLRCRHFVRVSEKCIKNPFASWITCFF